MGVLWVFDFRVVLYLALDFGWFVWVWVVCIVGLAVVGFVVFGLFCFVVSLFMCCVCGLYVRGLLEVFICLGRLLFVWVVCCGWLVWLWLIG